MSIGISDYCFENPIYHSILPLFQSSLAAASYGLTMNEGSSSALVFCCDR
jgi:hypothetical protein